MFSLTNQNANLTNVNPRAELHGEDKHLAADLKFEIKIGNDVLSEFDPSLKSSFYRPAEAGEGDLLATQPGNLPKLKFPLMGPVKWGKEFAGYEIVVHYGVSGAQDIRLIDCEVDNFRFDCQDGGTVVLAFRVIAHPEPVELGRLCEMIQQEVEISLVPPTEAEQVERELEAA